MRMARSVAFEGSISRGEFGRRIGIGSDVDLDQVVTRRHDPPAVEGGEPVEVLETIADHLGHHVGEFALIKADGTLGPRLDAPAEEVIIVPKLTAAQTRAAAQQDAQADADTAAARSEPEAPTQS